MVLLLDGGTGPRVRQSVGTNPMTPSQILVILPSHPLLGSLKIFLSIG